MQAELNQLREAAESSSAGSYHTPPPKVKAPTPGKMPNARPPGPPPPLKGPLEDVMPKNDLPPPETEAAKMQRLRRLCEKKPSGRCNVPEAIHVRWKNSTLKDKEAMIEELEAANWSKVGKSHHVLCSRRSFSSHASRRL